MSVIRLYRYLCTEYGMIGKRDYTAALGHNFQKIVIHEASYDTLGKSLKSALLKRLSPNRLAHHQAILSENAKYVMSYHSDRGGVASQLIKEE